MGADVVGFHKRLIEFADEGHATRASKMLIGNLHDARYAIDPESR